MVALSALAGAAGLAACAAPAASPTAAPAATTAPKPAAPAPTTAPAKPTTAAKPAEKAVASPVASPAAKPAAKAPTVLEQSKLKYSVVAGLFDLVFTLMADHKGFFKEQGLDVEIVAISSGAISQRALLAGETDINEQGTSNALIPASEGIDVKILGSHKPGNNYLLYTNRSDIRGAQDLEGKTIGHGGVNSTLHLLMLSYLEKYKVDPAKVNFVTVGNSTEVGRAVFAGKVDAGPSGADLMLEAQKFPEVRVIGNMAEELPHFIRILHATMGPTLKNKPEMVTAFLLASTRGIRYALDNKEEAIAFGVEYHQRDRASVEWSYNWYVQNKIINPNQDISPEALQAVQEAHMKVGLQKRIVPFNEVVDLSVQKRVIDILGPYRPKA